MASSRVPATIDKLVELWGSVEGLTVRDGPVVTADPGPALWVGYDGDPEGEFTTADPGQEWAGLGAKRRDEEFDIPCAVVVQVGNTDTKSSRDTAYAMSALAENKLREDPGLGMPPDFLPFVAEFRPGPVFTEPNWRGFQVRIAFNVHVKTRI